MRGLHAALGVNNVPVRVNALAPSWTATSMVQEEMFKQLGIYTQPASAVARAAAKLMADETRRGQLIHIDHELFKEIDETLLRTYDTFPHKETTNEDEGMGLVAEHRRRFTDAK